MNIQDKLEQEHNKKTVMQIVRYVGHDKTRFNELLNIYFKADKKLKARAAWSLGYVAEGNPRFIEPHLKKLIHELEQPNLHAAVARNILRILQEYDVPENYHGELIDICFRLILNVSKPIAVRAFALTTAANIAQYYPELKKEMMMVIEELKHYPQTPALRVRIKNAVKTLKAEIYPNHSL